MAIALRPFLYAGLLLELENTLRRKEVEAEQVYGEKCMQIEYQLQDLVLHIERAELAGDLQQVGDLTKQTFELGQALRPLRVQAMPSHLERQRQRFRHERKESENLQP